MSTKRQVRIYIEDEPLFDGLKGGSGVGDSQLATMVMHAAMEAIRENGGRAGMPMRFRVADSARLEAEESPHPKRKAV